MNLTAAVPAVRISTHTPLPHTAARRARRPQRGPQEIPHTHTPPPPNGTFHSRWVGGERPMGRSTAGGRRGEGGRAVGEARPPRPLSGSSFRAPSSKEEAAAGRSAMTQSVVVQGKGSARSPVHPPAPFPVPDPSVYPRCSGPVREPGGLPLLGPGAAGARRGQQGNGPVSSPPPASPHLTSAPRVAGRSGAAVGARRLSLSPSGGQRWPSLRSVFFTVTTKHSVYLVKPRPLRCEQNYPPGFLYRLTDHL